MNYKLLYQKLVRRIKSENRVRSPNLYVEKHHIKPKCLGGKDTKNNIILATPKEHYVLHHLLCLQYRTYKNSETKSKLASAFHIMCFHNSNNRKITSRMFNEARKEFSKHHPMRLKRNRDKVSATHKRLGVLIRENTYKNLPYCACGCGSKVLRNRNRYLWGHFPRENIINSAHTPEANLKRKKTLTLYIDGLSSEQQQDRLLRSLRSKKVDHKKRGKSISLGKKGKPTNQKQIAIARFKSMTDIEFQNYIKNMPSFVQKRYINWKQKYG